MIGRAVTGIRRAVQRVRGRIAAGTIILMYHRIGDPGADPWQLCVTPRHFDDHLAVLRGCARPISLQALAAAARAGRTPRRGVVVTFDDGYADNLHHARPILERHAVPATVFLTSGHLGSEREFWWDELERLVLLPPALPPALALALDDATHHFTLDEVRRVGDAAPAPGRPWDAPSSSRLGLYYALWQRLRLASSARRQQALADLATWAGCAPATRATHRPLTREEARALGSGDLVELGAHTVSHPFLSALPPAAQRHEIESCKADLEALGGTPLRSFAYPHGDYDAATPSLVRDAGFSVACTTVATSVREGADLYQLPRIEAHDWSGDEFSRQLRLWLGR